MSAKTGPAEVLARAHARFGHLVNTRPPHGVGLTMPNAPPIRFELFGPPSR